MKISTATWCDVIGTYEGGVDALTRHLEVFRGTPFCNFELDFGGTPDEPSMWYDDNDSWKGVIESVGQYTEDQKYTLIGAHAPMASLYWNEDGKEKYRRAVRRCIKACAILGIPAIVIHGLDLWKEPDAGQDRVFDVNRDFYLEFAEAAEKYNVDLLAENFARNVVTYPFTTGQRMRDFVDWAGIPRLHLLWDTGHANLYEPSSQYDDIIAMGKELHGLHIHDNWGGVDCHSIPFNGTVNFDAIIRGLIDVGYQGYFNFEASDMFIISNEEGRGRKRQGRTIGDKLADPPASVLTRYFDLLHALGKWMLSEYGLYEE